MIILDTNVLSEFMRAEPEPGAATWVAAQPRALLYTTSINRAEIRYGLARLPEGRKRTALAAAADMIFTEDFDGRVLPFDGEAADRYAEIVVMRRRQGRPIDILDAQIAAIALAVGAEIATRDVGGFEGCGLRVIDPWMGP